MQLLQKDYNSLKAQVVVSIFFLAIKHLKLRYVHSFLDIMLLHTIYYIIE